MCKPNIALIIDQDDWAFANIAKQLVKHLSDRFDFYTIPVAYVGNPAKALMVAEGSDLIHFFWRADLFSLVNGHLRDYIASLGGETKYFLERFSKLAKITTSVFDHLFLENNEIKDWKSFYHQSIDGYTVCSQKLYDIYHSISAYPLPYGVLEDGVDHEQFIPKKIERFKNINRPLIIGWVGNSAWVADIEDFKGVHTILKPALDILKSDGYSIKKLFADKVEKYIPHIQMADYYASIDILVCTSKIEGTPNPVLEAMACGVPVVATDVGIVNEVFGSLQKQFILPGRSIKALVSVLKTIIDDKALLADLSDENLISIQSWSWENKAKKYGDFFHCVLQGE